MFTKLYRGYGDCFNHNIDAVAAHLLLWVKKANRYGSRGKVYLKGNPFVREVINTGREILLLA
jgi:hypothetical protein